MKIEITNDEFYEIKMPEQIGLQEFRSIVMKFNFLLKNFSKFDIGEQNSDEDIVLSEKITKLKNNRDVDRWRILRDDRELFIKLLKVYYLKTPEELETFMKENDIYFKRAEFSSTQMIRLRELHKLNPNEINLKQFPSKSIQLVDCLLNTDGEI